MGKNDNYRSGSDDRPVKPKVHPVWRGIGFVFMILIPIMSYAGADVLIMENNKNHWIPFPYDLLAHQGQIFFTLTHDQYIHIKLILMAFLMFLMYGVFSLITFSMNSAFGVSRYGPYDLPPIDRKVRKKAR